MGAKFMEWKDIVKQKGFSQDDIRRFGLDRMSMTYSGKRRKSRTDEYIKNIENRLNQLFKDLEVIEGQEVLDGNLPKEMVDKLNLLIYAQLELQTLSNSLTRGKPLRD